MFLKAGVFKGAWGVRYKEAKFYLCASKIIYKKGVN